ncbi:hypothetical protein BLJAPNOD_05819 [Ensifer sp. M14]|jgi:hypothetical protein|uniref:hypothetical protein n=1 Tax=Sinorhizobium/Ensifer group TaxID=227292 RepID=UPI00098460BE|nr:MULTISPECIES: hypothetical protein [Sinorhizobium/Ensifer group]OOG71262.1 hypothetical protein B0E45_11280 [Sinorhizobium sp. A49]RDL46983.1 hypothetical protein BLJAPNOD_05819 [Ensifer sp. M14]
MYGKYLCAAAMVFGLTTPAFSQADIVCDTASLTKLETDASSISDGAKKIEATKEIGMAKEAMAANDMEKCKSHMGNAVKGMDAM